jgi:hypothetical protein
MKIEHAIFSNGWYFANCVNHIKIPEYSDTIIIYFKRHDENLFSVLGKSQSSMWKTVLNFNQLKILCSGVVSFDKIKDKSGCNEVTDDFINNAKEKEIILTEKQQIALDKMRESVNEDGMIDKNNFVSLMESVYNDDAKQEAINMFIQNLIEYDENGNWYLLYNTES